VHLVSILTFGKKKLKRIRQYADFICNKIKNFFEQYFFLSINVINFENSNTQTILHKQEKEQTITTTLGFCTQTM
jgi:hypothetical protein